MQDRVMGQRRPHHVLRPIGQLCSMPVVCVLIAWLWLGFIPAHDAGGMAPASVAVIRADEPKPDDKKAADQKDENEKEKEGTQAGESGDKEDEAAKAEDEKKPEGAKKDEGGQEQEKAEGKAKEDKKPHVGTLSEEDLAKMRQILMEKARERQAQKENKKANEPAAEKPEADEDKEGDSEDADEAGTAKQEPETKPASTTQPESGAASAETEEESESVGQPEPGQDEGEEPEAGAETEHDTSAGKPRSIQPRSRTSRIGRHPSTRTQGPARPTPRIGSRTRAPAGEPSGGEEQVPARSPSRPPRRGAAREAAQGEERAAGGSREPSIIMPVDLPPGKRAWEMPEDWRPFFFSFENVPWQDVLEDWSRMAGLSILDLDRAKGQLSYEGLDYMNYWEAFGLLNELLANQNVQLYQDRQHLRLINPSELREYITQGHTFTSREDFERAHPHDWEPVKVFFVPPPNVAETQVAQWLNDLPPSALVGAAADGYMHVSANAKDVRKLFHYVDIVAEQAQNPPEPRPWRWIPVENIDVHEAAELARRFVDTQAAAPRPRGRKAPAPSEALDDYSEVDVIAVPAIRKIVVRAIPAVADRIEELVREVDSRAVEEEDIEPVIIPLEHADAEETVELLESILSDEPAAAQGKRPTRRRSVSRRRAAAADAEELDLTRAGEDIQLIPDTNTNSIIVIADKDGVARVRKLLAVFDVPGSAPVFERVVLQHAEVESVEQVLKTLHGGTRGRKRTEAELTVIPDPAANALFLAGTEDAVGKAREVVAQMDVETASSQTHMVTLTNQEPSALAKILEQMEAGSRRRSKGAPTAGGVNIIGDDTTGVLIVVCPDNRWPDLKDLIEKLDRDVSEFQVTRTFHIEGADAEQVGKLLNEMFKGRQPRRRGKNAPPADLSINVDPGGNLIFVRGDEDTIAEMAGIISEMEAEAANRESVRRTFELAHADASEMVKALTSFYPATTPGRGRARKIVPGEAIFAPVGDSVVIVETTSDKMEEIAELIGELDREDRDSETIRSFVVKDADTQQVVRALETMFAQGGRRRKGPAAGGPSFTAAGKKVIVVAEPALFPRIEEAIAQFEGEGSAMEYRRYVVQYADVDELAKLLEDLLATRAAEEEGEVPSVKGRRRRGGSTSGGVVVSADPRTKTLFVAAPGEVMVYADELIETLDAPQPADLEEVVIRTVQLERADAEEMISTVQQMMTGRSVSRLPRPTGKTKGVTPPRVTQTGLTDAMKGEVSMVPALGTNAIVLRGIASDVDQVEDLIVTLDGVSQSTKKVAQRYDATPTGLGPDELADTVMAVVDSGKGPRPPGSEEDFAVGPRVGSDLVITTDWYTDTLLVIAAPEKQAEVGLLLDALSLGTEGPEGAGVGFPIQMVEIKKADPYDVVAALEDIIDEMVEHGPKTRVGVVEGTNLVSLTGPSSQLEVLMPVIDKLDKPGRRPPALQIRSVSSPVPLGEALRLVKQQLPDIDLVIESEGPVLPGYDVEEVSGVEEIKPTLGPNTLAYISAELQRLMLAAGAQEDAAGQEPEPTTQAKEPPAESQPGSAAKSEEKAEEARPKVKISYDPETNTIRLSGSARDVEAVSDAIDEVLDELKKLPTRPDIRVFRIKYANVNDVAQIMETILGAQSGGAASRAQQQLAQRLQLQQQLLRQRQAQQQQQALRRMQQQLLGRGGAEKEEEEEPKEEAAEEEEHEDEPKEFGTSRIRIYPDPRTSTIVVRAATEDYPTIIELVAKIDRPAPSLTEFKIFKLAKLKAADVEEAIKAILGLDRQQTRVSRPTPGRRPGQQGSQAQMIAQLQQQMDQMAQAEEGAVSIDWATQVAITSDAPTNSILASGPKQAIDYIGNMIEKLEGQDIEKEIVKSIELQHTTVEDALPVLNEIFAARGTTGGAGGRLRMPARQGEQEAVEAAFAQVLITGDPRTNTLIVKAVEKDMAEVEALIAKLDVDTGEEGHMQPYRLQYADAASMAKSMMDIYGGADRKASRVKIVADAGTNTILLAAPPALRDEIVAQIESLDRLAGEGSQTRTIAVTAGNAETIATKLQQVFGQRGKLGGEVSIVGDNTSDQLLVRAPDAVFEQIKTLAGTLDQGTASTVRVYELQHAVAEEVVASMRDAVAQLATRGAGKGVGMEAFSFTADPRTNSIVVVGDEKTHGLISTVLAQLDVPPKDSTQVATMIFPLTISDANEVARQVQQLFAGRRMVGVEPPVATPNIGMNTLVVRGTQAQLDEVQKLINDLEEVKPPGQGEQKNYTIRLLYAKAEDVANTLNDYFNSKFNAMRAGNVKGVKPTDMQVTIAPDVNSNQLFVFASDAIKAEIDRLIETMDVEGAGAANALQTKIFAMTFADPNQTANAVNNAFTQRGRFAESERVQAVPEYGTRSVIVTANAENMAKVEDLLTQLDSDTGHGRKNFTYQVKEARVMDLVNVMRDFVNQSMTRTGRGQLPITLVANEATNTMLVSCTATEYDELKPIIELLDRPPEAATGRYAKAYKLKFSDPGSVQNIIQNAFQERGRLRPEDTVTSAVDWGTSMLIVVANEENHAKVASLLEEMDQAEVGGMEVRQIRVENAGAQEVTQALQQTFIQGQRQIRGASSMSIVNPPGTQVILVRSDQRTFEEIQAVVADLDKPDVIGKDMRVVVLEYIEAAEAKTILDDYLSKPGAGRGGPSGGQVTVTPAQSLNAVVLSGPTAQIEQAVNMVKGFDLDPKEIGGAPQVIQIEHGDAVQMAETLTRMFSERGGRGRSAVEAPVIEGMAGTNTLLVKARPADMSQIVAIVASLDTAEMAEAVNKVEIIPVAPGINIDDLAASIERAINEAERRRVQGQRGATANEITIETDARTNTLLVTATPAQVKQVRELVSTLETMKPVGPSRILIRKPVYRSATEVKQVLEDLIEEGSSSGSSSGRRSGSQSRPRRRSSGRGR